MRYWWDSVPLVRGTGQYSHKEGGRVLVSVCLVLQHLTHHTFGVVPSAVHLVILLRVMMHIRTIPVIGRLPVRGVVVVVVVVLLLVRLHILMTTTRPSHVAGGKALPR